MGNHLDQFLDQKYINLETYKKDGTPVRTPVWFVIDNDLIYVITRDSTAKLRDSKITKMYKLFHVHSKVNQTMNG